MYQLGCENTCFFLSERRLNGGVGIFPWEASGRQDRDFLRQNQHFSKPEKGGADMAVFRIEKARDYRTSLFNRPGFQQMIADIEAGLVKRVIIVFI